MLLTAGQCVEIVQNVGAVNAKGSDALDAFKPFIIAGSEKIDIFGFLLLGQLVPAEVSIFDPVKSLSPVLSGEHEYIRRIDLLF